MFTDRYPFDPALQHLPQIQEFTQLKRKAEAIAGQLLRNSVTHQDGQLIHQCAETLGISTHNPMTPVIKTWYCKHRACPICQWRKQMKRLAQMHTVLDLLKMQPSNHRWLFLTLTVQNCPVTELSPVLDCMNQAFSRMLRRKELQHLAGHLRNTEITEDTLHPGYVHPHFHCLLLVKPSMFAGKHYVKESRWAELWQEALGISYLPRVHVRGVARDGLSEDQQVINHVAYNTKVASSYEQEDVFVELVQQTKRKRLFSAGGLLRELMSSEERELFDDEPEPEHRVLSQWSPTHSTYLQPPL
ncbi:protein rep [Marinospirillum perlucidum]|uniref:protein rep n=1 Tax=Marinospirillum perlucidum TaxID=1982602 RepID=UPI000DF37CAA|nr:protein rep [Marinospirillum perlucidum]